MKRSDNWSATGICTFTNNVLDFISDMPERIRSSKSLFADDAKKNKDGGRLNEVAKGCECNM